MAKPDNYYRNILAKLLRLSFVNTEPAKEIIEMVFDDDDFKEQARFLGDAYMKPEYRKSVLVAKSVSIPALPALTDICKREKFGIIPIDFSGEKKAYSSGDKINVLILSLQEAEFNRLVTEAYAVSGAVAEIDRRYIEDCAKQTRKDNSLMTVRNVDPFVYEAMKRQRDKLSPALRFTLFPSKREAGNLDVSFFLKTEPMLINNGKLTEKNGPYCIPKIASVVLACALLDDPEHEEEFKKQEEEKKRFMRQIMEIYYAMEDAFYLVPATLTKSGVLQMYMDQNVLFDVNGNSCPSYVDFCGYVTQNMNGANRILVPMTEMEFQKNRNEIALNPGAVEFCKKNRVPDYIGSEVSGKGQTQKQLIDTLNRKRDEVLLMSDDFNGNNLENLDQYIECSVQEIMMREDEEWAGERDDRIEQDLLDRLSEYRLDYAFVEHNKVTELIEEARNGIDVPHPSRDGTELDR